jgi:hypothetical protein
LNDTRRRKEEERKGKGREGHDNILDSMDLFLALGMDLAPWLGLGWANRKKGEIWLPRIIMGIRLTRARM